MQEKKSPRRSNKDRSDETRGKLLAAARALFVEKGYAETGTPEIVKTAEVTRGALYHHFEDKADLFRAVVILEAGAVADDIDETALAAQDPIEALTQGAAAYFQAMKAPGRAQLLLVDGPAVLGPSEMAAIDRETGGDTLVLGLGAAAQVGGISDLPLEETATLLSAAFDRAALAVAEGEPAGPYIDAVRRLLLGVLR